MAAAFSATPAYWKIRDDLADRRVVRKTSGGRFCAGRLRLRHIGRSGARFRSPEALAQTMMKRQAEAEKAQTPPLDAAADPTAQHAFGVVCHDGAERIPKAGFGAVWGILSAVGSI